MKYFIPLFTIMFMVSSVNLYANPKQVSSNQLAEFINPYAMNLQMLGDYDDMVDEDEPNSAALQSEELSEEDISNQVEILNKDEMLGEKIKNNVDATADSIDRDSNSINNEPVANNNKPQKVITKGLIQGKKYTIYNDGKYKPGDDMLTKDTKKLLIINGVNPDGERWKELSFEDKKALLDKFTKAQRRKALIKEKRNAILNSRK